MNKEELKKEMDVIQEILDKIDSWEINNKNFYTYCKIYPQLRIANRIVYAIYSLFFIGCLTLVIYLINY